MLDLGDLGDRLQATHRDVVVAYNRIYKAKQWFEDGGAFYNLSAAPGMVVAENHFFDLGPRVAIYLDEGSRYITVRNNVVEDARQWLNINTMRAALPLRTTIDNRAIGNWHNTTEVGGIWTPYVNNLIEDDHLVRGSSWPAEARSVMQHAGLEASVGSIEYGEARPRAK